MSTVERPYRHRPLDEDFASDFERSGAFEKAASTFEQNRDGLKVKVRERIQSETVESAGLELPRVRLLLAIELDCSDDDPDLCDAELCRSLRDYCERVHRRLGERRS